MRPTADSPNRIAAELDSILPDNSNKAYDMYDVIKGIADDGEYMDCMQSIRLLWGNDKGEGRCRISVSSCFCR